MQEEFHLFFPRTRTQFNDNIVTFSINHMKCRTACVVYFILHCWEMNGEEILTENNPAYVGRRWVVDSTYSHYHDTFQLTDEQVEETAYAQIELVVIGVDDDNILKFNQCMLANKAWDEYHEPSEIIPEVNIEFPRSNYCNMYNNRSENYLQVIRPNGESFTTKKIHKAECTVLVPHLEGEPELDSPNNLMMEYMYQNEQITTIKNSGFKMGE